MGIVFFVLRIVIYLPLLITTVIGEDVRRWGLLKEYIDMGLTLTISSVIININIFEFLCDKAS